MTHKYTVSSPRSSVHHSPWSPTASRDFTQRHCSTGQTSNNQFFKIKLLLVSCKLSCTLFSSDSQVSTFASSCRSSGGVYPPIYLSGADLSISNCYKNEKQVFGHFKKKRSYVIVVGNIRADVIHVKYIITVQISQFIIYVETVITQFGRSF